MLFWGVGTQTKCAAVSSLAPGPSSTLSAGSAALRVACCFVQNSNQKASDNRMKGLSLRIQTFFRGNLSQPQCFLREKENLAPIRILLKHLNVSLGLLWEKLHRSFVPLAVGTFVALRCGYKWQFWQLWEVQEIRGFEEGLFVSACSIRTVCHQVLTSLFSQVTPSLQFEPHQARAWRFPSLR